MLGRCFMEQLLFRSTIPRRTKWDEWHEFEFFQVVLNGGLFIIHHASGHPRHHVAHCRRLALPCPKFRQPLDEILQYRVRRNKTIDLSPQILEMFGSLLFSNCHYQRNTLCLKRPWSAISDAIEKECTFQLRCKDLLVCGRTVLLSYHQLNLFPIRSRQCVEVLQIGTVICKKPSSAPVCAEEAGTGTD